MPPPRRIVSLLSSATELLYGIGAGELLSAVSHECDFPAAARDLPRATFSHVDSSRPSGEIDDDVKRLCAAGEPLYGLDVDLLRRLRPNLIVTQAQCDVCAVRYEDVAAAVERTAELRGCEIVALNPQSLADVFQDALRLGEAVGVTAQAERFVAELRQRLAAVTSQTQGLIAADRPRTICIEWTDPPMTAGNWTPELIQLAGGQVGLAIGGRHSGYVSWEAICAYDPEVLIIAPCGFDLPRTLTEIEHLRRKPAFASLTAVRTGRAFALDGNAYLNRSGPRLVDTVEILAHWLQPKRFPNPPAPAAWTAITP